MIALRDKNHQPEEEISHGVQEPRGSATSRGRSGQDAAQFADRRLRLPGGRARILQLARRAARLGRDLRAVRPVAPHGEPVRARQGRAQAAVAPRDQLVQEFLRRSGQAVRALHLRRLRDRRRHPVLSGRERARVMSAAIRPPTGSNSTPRPAATTSQTEYDDRSPSRPMGKPVTRKFYRYQIQGPNAAGRHQEAQRRHVPGHQVLPHGPHHHRGPQGARAAPRHGGRAGPRSVGPVRRGRRNPRRDPRGRQGPRHRAGRRARLRDQHAGVGLDSLAGAGGLLGRQAEALSRVAAGHELRGECRPRRQLRVEEHRGLLHLAVGARLRRASPSSTTTSSARKPCRRWRRRRRTARR